jgi:predicted MFS family arabinose efflux permease
MQLPSSPSTSSPASDGDTALGPWLSVLSVGIGAFALVTSELLPVGLLPSMAAELAISKGQAGLMITTPGIIAAFAAIFVTVGSGRLDRRIVLLSLTALLVASNLLVALAPSFGWILLGRAMLGVGVGGFWAIGTAIGPRLVSMQHAPRAMSIIFAGVSLGTVAGVPAGALVGELVGWRVAFGAASAIAVLVFIGQLFLLPKLPPTQAIRLRQLPMIFGIRRARLGLLATAMLFTGQFAAYTYIAPFLTQISHLSAGTISAMLLVYGATGFIGNIIGGWAAGRSERLTLTLTGALLCLATLALAGFGSNQIAAILIVAIWGFGFGAMPIAVQTWMYKAAPHLMEGSSALFVAIVQASLASGALIGGISVDRLGVVSAMVLGALFALGCTLTIWIFGKERAITQAAGCGTCEA